VFVGGASWGNAPFGFVDPAKLSQPAGGTASFTWFSGGFALPPGSHPVTVVVDSSNAVFENNETNNTLTQNLSCHPDLPDLEAVDVALDANCRIDVTFRNNGPLDVPDSAYSSIGGGSLKMFVDGASFGQITLDAADPAPHQSQPVGGTRVHKWFPNFLVPNGSHVVKLSVDAFNAILEGNEGNNTIEKVLTCQRPLPDLVPVDITVVPTGPFIHSPCKVMVSLKNLGPGPLPDGAYVLTAPAPTLQMWNGNAGFGGLSLGGFDPSKNTQPAGATYTSSWMTPTFLKTLQPGDYTLRIDVDNNDALEETNDSNNSLTKTVRCGYQILPPLP
jgi:subtilase family serine protease